MRAAAFHLVADDGSPIFTRRWPAETPRAIVQVAHGLAEHSERYAPLATTLNAHGFSVYANDHRGHGETARPDDIGYFDGVDGWNKCVGDMWSLRQRIGADNPQLPVFLLGHSMGSFMAQQLMVDHGDAYAGVALSGSNGPPPLIAKAGRAIARIERYRLGGRGRSPLLKELMFGDFNRKFAPNRTDFDWLSRDEAEVDKYIADPLCGFDFTTQLAIDLLDALGPLLSPERLARAPRALPLYLFSGAEDPVGANFDGLVGALRKAGMTHVAVRRYPGARHEMLNETNRAEAIADLVAWLDSTLAARAV
ncbi:MAG: alpha/beta hydrolase [Hyphomicrobiales bacterium]|nr:alpha/beta hydrolase [Hyphomicrobiales bacterium]